MRQLITKKQYKPVLKYWLFGRLKYAKTINCKVLMFFNFILFCKIRQKVRMNVSGTNVTIIHDFKHLIILGVNFKDA